jgi:hypothetical protein
MAGKQYLLKGVVVSMSLELDVSWICQKGTTKGESSRFHVMQDRDRFICMLELQTPQPLTRKGLCMFVTDPNLALQKSDNNRSLNKEPRQNKVQQE